MRPPLPARRLRLATVLSWVALACVLLGLSWGSSVRAAGPEDADGEASAGVSSVRRFALVVGANDGGTDRVPLQYAGTDAHAFAVVLRDIGGVRSEDLIELDDPTPAELSSAFEAMAKRLREATTPGVKLQLVFYYSGHSDEQGLLLAGQLVKYPELRSQVQSAPADVRIAILDSCASGAFTRLKGGTKKAPFLVGASAEVEGHAFLTSSSADEAAQESDRVGGSFFTHYLTTGLRGAADVDKDKIVTLSEAYEFAFDETLARTEATRGGPQHAAYDIQLAGSGDLVMTDLRRTSARLEIMPEVGGRIFVRSGRGHLAAELYKPEGAGPVLLALEAGHYQITVDDGETVRRADVTLAEGLPARLTNAGLVEVQREGTTARGNAPAPAAAPAAPSSGYAEIPLNVGVFPPLSINGQSNKQRIRNSFSLGLGWTRAARVDGVAVAFGATIVDEEAHGLQGALGAAITRGAFEGLQFGQFYNHAGKLAGVQAGFVNHADHVGPGAQLGIVNVAKTIEPGAQLGLVNTAGDVRGVQIGLVNYAKSADASIGLIAATKEHGVRAEVYTSDAASFNAGIRFGARYTYSLLSFGVHPFGDNRGWMVGGGVGLHLPVGATKLFFDLDLDEHAYARGFEAKNLGNGAIGSLSSFRLMFGYQPLKHVAVFGGPTVRVLVDAMSTDTNDPRGGLGYAAFDTSSTTGPRVRVWPGFVAGMRF